jgi:hypothetical protein
VDWNEYNEPPYFPQWLCEGETLELAKYDDDLRIEIDRQLQAMVERYDLQNIEGAMLDGLGKLLNEPRNGNDDNNYRLHLKLRILLNTTNGTVNDVIKVIKYFYTSEVVNIKQNYPAGLTILHDGEAPNNVDFNSIMAAVIPAGVGYDTKELFHFIETINSDDVLKLIVIRKESEHFGYPLKFNGAARFDGRTLNKKVVKRGKFNGVYKYNGELAFSGIGKIVPEYYPKPPFKFSSGVIDRSVMDVRKNTVSDQIDMNEAVSAGLRKHHHFDGSYKFDGAIQFDSGVLIPV